jgi:flagellar basal-body rod modification protein FlgD
MVANVTDTSSATTTKTAADTSKFSTDYSTFLNLLTAQIKNQDPLSPMDTTAWTAQLVQYSSVEQQLKANGYLETIAKNNTQNSMNAAVGYIGKTVTADQDIATQKDGNADWQYALRGEATKATLSVSDSEGKVVWSGDAGDLTTGIHDFSWDGKDSAGKALPEGQYQLSIKATNAAGDVDAAIGVTGTVTSAADVDGTVVLKVGNTSVPLSGVTSVS